MVKQGKANSGIQANLPGKVKGYKTRWVIAVIGTNQGDQYNGINLPKIDQSLNCLKYFNCCLLSYK